MFATTTLLPSSLSYFGLFWTCKSGMVPTHMLLTFAYSWSRHFSLYISMSHVEPSLSACNSSKLVTYPASILVSISVFDWWSICSSLPDSLGLLWLMWVIPYLIFLSWIRVSVCRSFTSYSYLNVHSSGWHTRIMNLRFHHKGHFVNPCVHFSLIFRLLWCVVALKKLWPSPVSFCCFISLSVCCCQCTHLCVSFLFLYII